jgi:phosphoglycolate phosphatase
MALDCRLCIFDLDGTLVDSLRDIAESVNESLELLGLPTHPIDRYRYMVGEGVPVLCRRAIGASHPHLVARLMELTRARYRVRPLRHTRPYAGIAGLVSDLRAAGLSLAALSNKPHDMTVRVIREFWPGREFSQVQGYDGETRRKPDPSHVLSICRGLGFTTGETCLIGDTPTDVETARNSGARIIAVTWGFRTRDDLAAAGAETIVDSPVEVLEVITKRYGHETCARKDRS